MTGARWRRGRSFPVKRFLLDSEQTAVLRLGFQARRGAARGNGILSSLSTTSDSDFSALGLLIALDYGFWVAERLPLTYALWARSPSGPWDPEGTLTVNIFLPTCVSAWAQPEPFQKPQTRWFFQRL